MFVRIQAVDLHLRRYAQPDRTVDQFEHDEHREQHVGIDREDSQRLHAQQPRAASIEQALHDPVFAGTEQTHRQRAPDAVDHMYGDCAYGVVYFDN